VGKGYRDKKEKREREKKKPGNAEKRMVGLGTINANHVFRHQKKDRRGMMSKRGSAEEGGGGGRKMKDKTREDQRDLRRKSRVASGVGRSTESGERR